LTKTHHVVVVPFFISDGLHSYEDIPALLGIVDAAPSARSSHEDATSGHVPEVFRRNPYKFDNRSLFYAPSIGTDPGFADIILEQALNAKS
jgi:sirohydrochlorin cobaltochelatase